ncbi:hypothetical protein ABZ864_44735 [Streptomyces sp. NPDC047082]|uniref:hypothetical protein n=1 Tax=Streptomyces sp. NPDC047082 TaxID=3155259 RepID=UPI0033FC8B2B
MNHAQQLADRAQEVRRPRIAPDALATGERVRVQPQLVSSPQAVELLAEWLLAPARSKPVIVISIASGHTEAWIDAARLAAEIGDRAEIYLIPTGKASWALADRLPARTEVYGGAGRLYPVGTDWTSNPYRAPLRLAWATTDGPRATDALLDDVLTLAPVDRPEETQPSSQAQAAASVTRPGLTGSDQAAASTDALHRIPTDPAAELSQLQLLVRAVRREKDRLGRRLEETETALTAVEADRDRQRERCGKADQRRRELEKELKAALARSVPDRLDEDAFCDPEEQFRHEVYLAWARRIPKSEKATRPLAPYVIGPDFLASLMIIEGMDRAKIVNVVVEVLTGFRSPGRDLHQLRVDTGGNSRAVVRADGAVCWRVALQKGSPAARRLHFWRSGRAVELSRVVVHDDMTP